MLAFWSAMFWFTIILILIGFLIIILTDKNYDDDL